MQHYVLTLKDDSKREFLLELLSRLEFVEIKMQKPIKAENGKKIASESSSVSIKRGSAKGLIGYVPDNFNEPLEDFKDYI